MIILKSDANIPFRAKSDPIPKEVREAARHAPYQKPSYRTERRKSVWLIAEPDMTPGASPDISLFGEAAFYMWSKQLRDKPTSQSASLVVTLQDEDIFHNKYLHAAWSHSPQRISINAWKIRNDWRPALQEALEGF